MILIVSHSALSSFSIAIHTSSVDNLRSQGLHMKDQVDSHSLLNCIAVTVTVSEMLILPLTLVYPIGWRLFLVTTPNLVAFTTLERARIQGSLK